MIQQGRDRGRRDNTGAMRPLTIRVLVGEWRYASISDTIVATVVDAILGAARQEGRSQSRQ